VGAKVKAGHAVSVAPQESVEVAKKKGHQANSVADHSKTEVQDGPSDRIMPE
jgi:hypothetical protein